MSEWHKNAPTEDGWYWCRYPSPVKPWSIPFPALIDNDSRPHWDPRAEWGPRLPSADTLLQLRDVLERCAHRAVTHEYVEGSNDGHECTGCGGGMLPGVHEHHAKNCIDVELRNSLRQLLAAL